MKFESMLGQQRAKTRWWKHARSLRLVQRACNNGRLPTHISDQTERVGLAILVRHNHAVTSGEAIDRVVPYVTCIQHTHTDIQCQSFTCLQATTLTPMQAMICTRQRLLALFHTSNFIHQFLEEGKISHHAKYVQLPKLCNTILLQKVSYWKCLTKFHSLIYAVSGSYLWALLLVPKALMWPWISMKLSKDPLDEVESSWLPGFCSSKEPAWWSWKVSECGGVFFFASLPW